MILLKHDKNGAIRAGAPGTLRRHITSDPARQRWVKVIFDAPTSTLSPAVLAGYHGVAEDQPPAFPAINFSNVSSVGSSSRSAASQRDGARSG